MGDDEVLSAGGDKEPEPDELDDFFESYFEYLEALEAGGEIEEPSLDSYDLTPEKRLEGEQLLSMLLVAREQAQAGRCGAKYEGVAGIYECDRFDHSPQTPHACLDGRYTVLWSDANPGRARMILNPAQA